MRHLPFWLIIISFFSFTIGYGQDNQGTNNPVIEEIVEAIAASAEDDEEVDYTDLYETLSYYYANPVNLNDATEEDLQKLQILNDFQINNLLKYRKETGKFLTLYELQAIKGFSPTIINYLLPFVTLKASKAKEMKFSPKQVLKWGHNQLFLRTKSVLETQKGYSPVSDSLLALNPNARYLGNKYKYYTRYKFYYKNNIFWGITAEKDQGEEFFKGSQKNGFDYYSAHLFFRNIGRMKKLAIGDYHLQFGQGLALWSGLSFGKSVFVLNTMKNATGINKYASVDENNFFRGVATSWEISNHFQVSAFYSNKKIDGNVTNSDTVSNEVLEVSSLQITGYHRTPNELADKHTVGLQVMGGNVSYRSNKHLKIGTTVAHYLFSSAVNKPVKPYNQYEFRGKQLTNGSIDYQYSYNRFYLFGEVAASDNGGVSQIHGANISLASNFMFSTLYRNYGKTYQSIYASPFGENSKPANEQGYYIGGTTYPYKNWEVSAYYDLFHFPWLKYRVDAPSSGYDYLVHVIFHPSRNFNMYWKYQEKMKYQNQSTDIPEVITSIVPVKTQRLRYHINYKINEVLELRNRIEVSRYQKDTMATEKGYMIYQDIIYKPKRIPLTMAFRFSLFDTDTYNSRIYAYENDILYAFSIPAYFYRGKRYYLTLKYHIANNVDLWLRFSQWYYDNKDVISSGLNEISGHTKSEVKAQLRLKF